MRYFDLPPVWLGLGVGAMWALARFAPIVTFKIPGLQVAGLVLIGISVGMMIWAAIWFRRRKTPIVPHQAPAAIITDGPFRLSRNPIYLADVLVLIGWALIFGALSALIVIPLFMMVITRRFITAEEERLAMIFPEAFAEWSGRVRRWI